MKKLKPSVKAYDFVFDIQDWLNENKFISSYKIKDAFSKFFAESNAHSMSNGCLFNFYFPEDENDYRFERMEEDLRKELFEILSSLEKEVGESEIKVYFWW
jgi:hypothetical protein